METRDRPSPTAGWFIVLCLLLTVPLTAQDFTVRPSVLVPVGDSTRWFETGFGLGTEWTEPLGGPWTFGMDFQTLQVPHKARGSLLFFTASPTLALAVVYSPNLAWNVDVELGWAMVSRSDFSQATGLPWGAAGASVRWNLEPTLAFRGGAQYQITLGLFQGVTAWAGFELTGG